MPQTIRLGCLLLFPKNTFSPLLLKGQCHKTFLLLVFSWISFPQAPEYSIKTDFNFFENSRIYRKSRCTTGINDTGGKQWEQLSNCWQLKMNLKNKIYVYSNSSTQRCPKKKYHKHLSDWRFFPFAISVNDTGGKPWAANISPNFRKNLKRP